LIGKVVSVIRKLKAGEKVDEVAIIAYGNDGIPEYRYWYVIRAYQYLKYNQIPYFTFPSIFMKINKIFNNKYKCVDAMCHNYKEFAIATTSDGKEVIIKREETDISREYEVGAGLMQYNKSYFVDVYDYKSDRGEYWLVMDRVKGVTLNVYIYI